MALICIKARGMPPRRAPYIGCPYEINLRANLVDDEQGGAASCRQVTTSI